MSRRLAVEAQCPVIVLARRVEASLEALIADAPGGTAAPEVPCLEQTG